MAFDLLNSAKLPKKADKPEEKKPPLSEKWKEFRDERTPDDSDEGIKERMERIDEMIKIFEEGEDFLVVNRRIRRVQIVQTTEFS